MLNATYPIIGSDQVVEIRINLPEVDLEFDFRVTWSIKAPNYSRENTIYGIDALQCIWLTLNHLRTEIEIFEKCTKMKCDYTFF